MKQKRYNQFDDMYIPEPNSGCYLWLFAVSKDGYGKLTKQGKKLWAHRYSYEKEYGVVVPSSVLVLHTCDNPCCVNPQHLFLGTHTDNMRDRARKGRVPSYVRRQTKEVVMEIFSSSISAKDATIRYGVSYGTVYNIRSGKTWSEITGARNNKVVDKV